MDESHVNSVQLLTRQHLLRKYTSDFPDLHCPFLFRWVPVQIWFVAFCSHTTSIKKFLGLCWAGNEISAKIATEVHEALQLLLKLTVSAWPIQAIDSAVWNPS